MSLRPLLITGAAALIAVSLSGCGKLGQLEKPGPLNRADRGATTRQADEAARQAQDPQRPVTIDPRDRDADPAPPRAAPIQSSGQNPFGAGPPGAFGTPFTNPR